MTVVTGKGRMGRSAWNHGAFHLWGNVPALMPFTLNRALKKTTDSPYPGRDKVGSLRMGIGDCGVKGSDGIKIIRGHLNQRDGHKSTKHLTNPAEHVKIGGDWFSDPNSTCRKHGSRSSARKAASALIARIPPVISEHIAEVYWPKSAT